MLMKISKVVVVLLLVGLALIAMLLLVVPGRHLLDEQRFYSMARKKEPFLLTELYPSERQCVLPARIGFWMLADMQKGDDEGDQAATWADSDHDWFIVLFQNAEPNLRVIAISERKVALANTVELANFNKICGEKLKVSFDKDGRAVFSP
jgi:hypothetical protein